MRPSSFIIQWIGPNNGNFWCSSNGPVSCPPHVWTSLGVVPSNIVYTNVITGHTTGNLYISNFGFDSGTYMFMFYCQRLLQLEQLNDYFYVSSNNSYNITWYTNPWLDPGSSGAYPYNAQSIGTHQTLDVDPINGNTNSEAWFMNYFTLNGPNAYLNINIQGDVPNITGTTFGGRIIIHRIADVNFSFVQA